ncbi:MAG: F0F1 ATP synthase subunit B [Thermoguttaceae bacterium]|nr:F0F1 ATP synthase subunit B [Thermoguttaceae bacterium]MBQ6619920.1 F0F1 ATP synthase subunit B [Thermoguttaceae bacterium]
MMPYQISWTNAGRTFRLAAASVICVLGTSLPLLAEEAAHEAEEGGLKPLAFQTDLALWTGIIFLGLLFILGKFAFRPIADALDAREKSMADKLAETDKANADAKALHESYQQKLAGADDEVRMILADAKDAAAKKRDELLAAAQADADEVRAKGKRDIESDREQMLNDLASRSASWATDLAGKILKEKIDPKDHARLIDDAVKQFSKG